MSTSPTPTTTTSSVRSKKVLIPKVWKRPHSTIYGKNVEFGSSLYSDKIGELNGRKFNSELPWSVRNSPNSSSATGSFNQGYLSTTFSPPNNPISCQDGALINSSSSNNRYSYAELLDLTNPNRISKRNKRRCMQSNNNNNKNNRIDFYDQYLNNFSKEIDHLNNSSLLLNEPLLKRKVFDNFLDFDYELGLFLPNYDCRDDRSLIRKSTLRNNEPLMKIYNVDHDDDELDINKKSFVPLPTKTKQTNLLPKHECQLMSSPYGQSMDGRKLSLGSINPHSYRPSLPQKTTTAHASDGEEFEFHDKSSPFYTDRWAGKTIRHFDSDLYSNANLFKSMIL